MEILGWTDEQLDCDVCGKTLDRRRTLAYRTPGGAVQYAGTDCAARVMSTTAARVHNAADAATTRAARQAQTDAANVDRWTRCLAAFRGAECPTSEEWEYANRCWEANSRSFSYKGEWLDWIEARLAEKNSCVG